VNPECDWDADVRLGDDLCLSERAFLRERKRVMKSAFAKLMEVPEEEVHEEDLPVVAIAGSGGGTYVACLLENIAQADHLKAIARC
jgi:phospholipase A2